MPGKTLVLKDYKFIGYNSADKFTTYQNVSFNDFVLKLNRIYKIKNNYASPVTCVIC